MKKISLLTLVTFGCLFSAEAQTKMATSSVIYAKADASPLDVVYFPLNTTKAKDGVAPVMRVLYSRPQKKGREVFGVLEQFGKIWRLGANESTEIQFFKAVRVNNKKN